MEILSRLQVTVHSRRNRPYKHERFRPPPKTPTPYTSSVLMPAANVPEPQLDPCNPSNVNGMDALDIFEPLLASGHKSKSSDGKKEAEVA